MNSQVSSLAQFPALVPAAAPEAVIQHRRGPAVVALAEQALFSVSILGSAVLAVTFLWQILQ